MTVALRGWEPGTPLAVGIDHKPLASVTIGAAETASVTKSLPAGIAPGMHAVTVTTADGRSVSTPLQVCVPIPGPHALPAEWLLYLIAVLHHTAC